MLVTFYYNISEITIKKHHISIIIILPVVRGSVLLKSRGNYLSMLAGNKVFLGINTGYYVLMQRLISIR